VSETDLATMIRRHQQDEQNFCQCCFQPWPCDFTQLLRIMKSRLTEVTK